MLREWLLRAVNVRTNHVHATVSAMRKPEGVLNAFKANSTRYLREAQLVSDDQKVWSRGGSTRYLWNPNHVNIANDYVTNGQEMIYLISKSRLDTLPIGRVSACGCNLIKKSGVREHSRCENTGRNPRDSKGVKT